MMGSKSLFYAIFAVVIGYLLIGAAPNQIIRYVTPEEGVLPSSPLAGNEAKVETRGDIESEKVEDSVKSEPIDKDVLEERRYEDRGFESRTSFPQQLWGLWIVDFLLAFGVYIFAKKRFTSFL
jgi:hypothetical protein